MFERLDGTARKVLDEALAEARRLGHNHLGTEHMLIAFLLVPDALPVGPRSAIPVAADAARADVRRILDAPGKGSDAALLDTLGIDLDEVRRRAEATFGPAALSRAAAIRRRRPWWRARRRPHCMPMLMGEFCVAARMKRALERTGAKGDPIDPVRLLLAILDDEEALATRLLRRLNVDPESIRVELLRSLP